MNAGRVSLVAAAADRAYAEELADALRARGVDAAAQDAKGSVESSARVVLIWSQALALNRDEIVIDAATSDLRLVRIEAQPRVAPYDSVESFDIFGMGSLRGRQKFNDLIRWLEARSQAPEEARIALPTSPSATLIERANSFRGRADVGDSRKGFGIGCLPSFFGIISMLLVVLAVNANHEDHAYGSFGGGGFLGFSGGVWILVFLSVLLSALASAVANGHRKARQRELDAYSSGGGFVLYFRPFTFDLQSSTHVHSIPKPLPSMKAEKIVVPLEETIAEVCRRAQVGLRSIGAKAGQFGPTALTSTDWQWQQDAKTLMRDAILIVVIPGSTPGSHWEIEQIIENNFLARTLWIMPPLALTTTDANVEIEWNRVRDQCARIGFPFPEYADVGGLYAYGVDSDGALFCHRTNYALGEIARIVSLARASARGERIN